MIVASLIAALTLQVAPPETRYGSPTEISGTAPAGQTVRLEGKRYPFDADFRVVESTTAEEDGTFRFEREFERNWRVRVRVADEVSETAPVYVFPRFTLRFEARNERVIRLVQRYRVPHGVDLERPTIFYVGRRGARTAPRAARVEVERTGSGRYRSVALVRIPSRWNGRFRYASCFRYTPGSGMGDPRASCPRRFRF